MPVWVSVRSAPLKVIVPLWVKDEIFVPHRLKGIPCLVAWFVMQAELLRWAPPATRG